MEITSELLNEKRKEYFAIAKKYKNSDFNKYIYTKGKARAMTELINLFVAEEIYKKTK